jgi:hypothetical protein
VGAVWPVVPVRRLGCGWPLPMFRLSTVGPYSRLAHLPLYVVADAPGLRDEKVDRIKEIREATLFVFHADVVSKDDSD